MNTQNTREDNWLFRDPQRIRDFLASSELSNDPMRQDSMETMWAAYLIYYEPRETPEGVRWFKKPA